MQVQLIPSKRDEGTVFDALLFSLPANKQAFDLKSRLAPKCFLDNELSERWERMVFCTRRFSEFYRLHPEARQPTGFYLKTVD